LALTAQASPILPGLKAPVIDTTDYVESIAWRRQWEDRYEGEYSSETAKKYLYENPDDDEPDLSDERLKAYRAALREEAAKDLPILEDFITESQNSLQRYIGNEVPSYQSYPRNVYITFDSIEFSRRMEKYPAESHDAAIYFVWGGQSNEKLFMMTGQHICLAANDPHQASDHTETAENGTYKRFMLHKTDMSSQDLNDNDKMPKMTIPFRKKTLLELGVQNTADLEKLCETLQQADKQTLKSYRAKAYARDYR
jgi:hypothetical protein